MAEPHVILNALDPAAAAAALRRACGAERWVARMLARRPYASSTELFASADAEWRAASREDYLEAFAHHPQIGENLGEIEGEIRSPRRVSPDVEEVPSAGCPIVPNLGHEVLERRFQGTASLSSREQAGVAAAGEATLGALRDANIAYRQRFGYIFIICATGKSAAEMLAALRLRLDNDAHAELAIAAGEHAKITRLRLAGLAP